MHDIRKIETHSSVETQLFAEDFAKSIHGGDVIALHGDLGYGKTTFVQGLAKGLGIEQKVISPTFTIVREYHKLQSDSTHCLYHIDLYRVESKDDLNSLGLAEILGGEDNIVVIEWPEKMGDLLPGKRIDVTLDYIDESTRSLVVESKS